MWQSQKRRQIFQGWETSIICVWKRRLLKTEATICQSMDWNPSYLIFSNLNQVRIELIFAKWLKTKIKMLISWGKLHRKKEYIFSSFNVIYLFLPLLCLSNFFFPRSSKYVISYCHRSPTALHAELPAPIFPLLYMRVASGFLHDKL